MAANPAAPRRSRAPQRTCCSGSQRRFPAGPTTFAYPRPGERSQRDRSTYSDQGRAEPADQPGPLTAASPSPQNRRSNPREVPASRHENRYRAVTCWTANWSSYRTRFPGGACSRSGERARDQPSWSWSFPAAPTAYASAWSRRSSSRSPRPFRCCSLSIPSCAPGGRYGAVPGSGRQRPRQAWAWWPAAGSCRPSAP